jgi:hypothetical protein
MNLRAYYKCLGDDVLLLFPIFHNFKNEKNKLNMKNIAFNLKKFPDHDYENIKNIIEQLLKLSNENNYHIEYFCFGQNPGPDDYDVLSSLNLKNIASISAIHNPYEEGFDTFIENLKRIKFGFGFAYHFNIILTIMSIPSISVYAGDYYKQKIKGSMELFNVPFVFDINEINNNNLETIINEVSQKEYREGDGIEKFYKNMVKEYSVMYKNILFQK